MGIKLRKKLSENDSIEQELFVLEPNGKVTITNFAKKFYKSQGLDPKKMADAWVFQIAEVALKKVFKRP